MINLQHELSHSSKKNPWNYTKVKFLVSYTIREQNPVTFVVVIYIGGHSGESACLLNLEKDEDLSEFHS